MVLSSTKCGTKNSLLFTYICNRFYNKGQKWIESFWCTQKTYIFIHRYLYSSVPYHNNINVHWFKCTSAQKYIDSNFLALNDTLNVLYTTHLELLQSQPEFLDRSSTLFGKVDYLTVTIASKSKVHIRYKKLFTKNMINRISDDMEMFTHQLQFFCSDFLKKQSSVLFSTIESLLLPQRALNSETSLKESVGNCSMLSRVNKPSLCSE